MIIRVPTKPGHPVARRDRGIYVTVEWTEPEDNGGTDITGYVIKYVGRPGRYMYFSMFDDEDIDADKYDELSVNENTTHFQFTHQLNAMTSYQFAVAAVNDAGRGEFSEFTDYVGTWCSEYCCLSNAIHCMGQNIKSLAACVCVCVHGFWGLNISKRLEIETWL